MSSRSRRERGDELPIMGKLTQRSRSGWGKRYWGKGMGGKGQVILGQGKEQ